MGDLNWEGSTNTEENSCQTLQCDCLTFWEIHQQEAMKRVSNIQSTRNNLYKLEPGYEARARRIASVYAKIYLEQENHGNRQLIGRYYWMGLGAFASKTVAAVFKHGFVAWGYRWIPVISSTLTPVVRGPVHSFAKGNLWLFMDIAPWHYAWSMSSASFNQCRTQRDVSKFTHIKEEVLNLPWSRDLPIIQNLKSTPEIERAFRYLPNIEAIFRRRGKSRRENFEDSKDDLFRHLMSVAVQEQRNILQVLVWRSWRVQLQATLQSYTDMPDSTLVLSSDYGVNAVKPDENGQYKGRHAGVINQLPESVYSQPFEDTIVHNYDSRMNWIREAARKYHRLMLSDTGRPFLERELAIIARWGNSRADFRIGRDSNDGKI